MQIFKNIQNYQLEIFQVLEKLSRIKVIWDDMKRAQFYITSFVRMVLFVHDGSFCNFSDTMQIYASKLVTDTFL